MKCTSLKKTSGKQLQLKLNKRMTSVMDDHKGKGEENPGVSFVDYPSINSKKRNKNP